MNSEQKWIINILKWTKRTRLRRACRGTQSPALLAAGCSPAPLVGDSRRLGSPPSTLWSCQTTPYEKKTIFIIQLLQFKYKIVSVGISNVLQSARKTPLRVMISKFIWRSLGNLLFIANLSTIAWAIATYLTSADTSRYTTKERFTLTGEQNYNLYFTVFVNLKSQPRSASFNLQYFLHF